MMEYGGHRVVTVFGGMREETFNAVNGNRRKGRKNLLHFHLCWPTMKKPLVAEGNLQIIMY